MLLSAPLSIVIATLPLTACSSFAASIPSGMSATASATSDPHPFNVHDMLAMQRLGEPALSPDGKWLVFSVRTTDVEANKGRYDLWLTGVDGTGLRRLTTNEANDTSPRWMPDSKSIAFLSTRGGSSQVWRLALDGGEGEQLTHFPLDVDNLRVFPDGKRLLVTMEVYPDVPKASELADTAKRDEERAKSKVKARIYDHLMFRHWDNWEDGKSSHVFAFTIGGGEPLDLMAGMDADSPPKPFGGAEELSISPDGREVAFGVRTHMHDEAWSTNNDIYLAPSDASSAPRNLTSENKATDGQPCFSPDGRWLAYLAMARAGYESDRQRIVVMDMHDKLGAVRRSLTEAWDRSPTELAWSPDSKTIYTTADNLGQKSLFAVDAKSGNVTTLVEQGTCGSVCASAERVFFMQDTLTTPDELFLVQLNEAVHKLHAITNMNASNVAAAEMGAFEQFEFTGAKNEKVHAFVVKPANFQAGQKYPVVFLIHGGPQGSFGNHFHYRWNPEAYCGAGYAAVMVDFHGSTGYGQAFVDAINGDWGGAPYEDLMKGLDAALAKYDYLDGSRVGALGASFGGYMINWVAGHTDRFRCLVNHDGNIDERMAYFDTEELWFPEWEHGGVPWGKPEGYMKHNPIDFVQNWKTPMLVVHGGQDFRVVETQGMGTFTALQRKGIPSKFLYFPDENHWVLKPQNSILWHETVLGWLDQWTKKGTGAAGGAVGGR